MLTSVHALCLVACSRIQSHATCVALPSRNPVVSMRVQQPPRELYQTGALMHFGWLAAGEGTCWMMIRSTDRSMSQHSMAQHSTAQHSTAQHSPAQHGTAQHSV